MIRVRNRALLLLAAALLVGASSCAPKTEEGPAGEVDAEFLKETLGGQADGKEAEAKRQQIEERRKQREAQEEEAKNRKARELAQAEARRKASPPGGAADPQRAKLEEICKRCGFHLDEKNLDGALEQAKALVAERPNSPDTRTALGIVQRQRGKLEEALKEFQTAVDLDPANDWAAANLGLALRRQGTYPKAAEVYEAASAVNPKAQLVHYQAGVLYEIYLADKVKAIQHYIAYLNAGGERQEEVNGWITTLASDLGVERPRTPGYVPPAPAEEAKPAEEAPPAGGAPAAPAPAAEGAVSAPASVPAPSAQAPAPAPVPAAVPEAGTAGAAPSAAVPVGASAPVPAPAVAATVAAVVPAVGAAAVPPPPAATLPQVTLYQFAAGQGEVPPRMLERLHSIFAGELASVSALSPQEKISEIEKRENLVESCKEAKCRLRVTSLLGADYLVHGEAARIGESWSVTAEIYDLKAKKKSRLKFEMPVGAGEGPLLEKAGKMARAVGQKISSGLGGGDVGEGASP